jgi:uncharacterized protein YbjT (DUF2867 family)
MQSKPIILVTGATGAQGGSVAETLLSDNKFTVRIFTRNPDSPQAIALEKAGAQIAVGDLNNIASIKKALQNVYGVFGVTNFWEHYESEYHLGKNLIDAVNQSDVKHFVFSALANYKKLSNGEFQVPHCDLKAELEDYTKDLKIPFTFIRVAFYYENFSGFLPLEEDINGNLHFGFPQGNTKLAMTSVTDVGGVVATIFDHPNEYIGRTVGVVGDDKPCAEYAYILSKALQRNVYYTPIPYARYAALGFPGVVELANMFEVQRRFIPDRLMDLIESYGLNPHMQTFETWVNENKQKLLNTVKTHEAAIY